MSQTALTRLVLTGLFALAAATPALAAEWRDVPYADVAKFPLIMAKVDPEHVYSAVYMATPAKGQTALPADLRLQVKAGGKVNAVVVQANGRFDLPIRQDWADQGAVFQVNQPKTRVNLGLSLDSRVPPGTRMSYAKLSESAPVMERGIREMAGMMSFMAPKMRELTLRFEKPGPQTVVLTLPDGTRKQWKTDAKGGATLPCEPKWLAGTVELSAPLKAIDQVVK